MFPPKQKTWTISYNNAITGATLNEMMGNYLFALASFFLANGYTCKGSSDGATAAMDGVNRWAAATDADTRGANTTSANSWLVMTDGNGCDILLSYVGSTDDIAYIAFSPGGLYVVAGTATHTPTATDQLGLSPSSNTVINATAAATQRNLFMWVDSEAKLMRVLLIMNGAAASPCGLVWGVELADFYLQDKTPTPAVWGFRYAASAGLFNLGPGTTSGFIGNYSTTPGALQGGQCRINGQQVDVNGGVLEFEAAAAGGFALPWSNTQTPLQGAAGYPIWGPLRIGSRTAQQIGMVAQLYDWWTCRYNNLNTSLAGDTYDNLNFMAVGLGGGLLWPGDGATVPVTGGVSTPQPGEHAGFQNADDPAYGSFMNGASMYVPLPASIVTPTGPESPKSINRRAGVDIIRLNEMAADPPAEAGRTLLYTRMIAGQQALFARYPDGTIYMVGAGSA